MMKFLSQKEFLEKILLPSDANNIVREAKRLLKIALKPEFESKLDSKTYLFNKPVKIKKIMGALGVFQTQRAGGFQVEEYPDRTVFHEKMKTHILKKQNEGTLVFGIEAGVPSVINDLSLSSRNQLAVYQSDLDIQTDSLVTNVEYGGDKQRISIHTFSLASGRILTGHFSSGTQDKIKDPQNRDTFINILTEKQSLCSNKQRFMSDFFAAFFDANFDATAVDNLQQLLDVTSRVPFSIYIPNVKIRKIRIANAPFENNQLHKGGTERIAESMLMVVNNHVSVKPLGEPLYRLRAGKIDYLSEEDCLPIALDDISFEVRNAFSDTVLLDHQPIAAMLNGQKLEFHNFMDFMGERGIEPGWYQKEGSNSPFQQAQSQFIQYLAQFALI